MKSPGFTLTELLVALYILGVLATFTIPKVLTAQQGQRDRAAAKEAAAAFSEAFQIYRYKVGVTTATSAKDLTPYINYVKLDTSSVIDDVQTAGNFACDTGNPCLLMHNGTRIWLDGRPIGGTATTNAIDFLVDPDGKETVPGGTTGPGKSIQFFIYPDGALRTWGTIRSGTMTDGGSYGPAQPSYDPPWFSWN